MGLPISTIVVCLLGLIVGCSSAKRPTSPETAALPAYTPIESAIFDDEFHSASLSGGAWSADQKFGDRVRLADAVVVARTKTASQQPSPAGQPPDVVVAFLPLGNPLKGKAGSEPIRVTLAPNSPSYRLFRWRQPALLGKDVVLLYRRYLQDGEETIHFRAEPDTVEVRAAVQQALSVQH